MDQRARDVQEDLENIDRTRAALDEKLQLLDRHIKETFRETRAATLEVLERAGAKVSHLLDPAKCGSIPYLFSRGTRRPLTVVGGVVALALLARWIDRRHRAGGVYPYFPPKAQGADVMPDDGHPQTPRGVYPFFPDAEYRRFDRRRSSGEVGRASRSPVRRHRPMFHAAWEELSEEVRLEGAKMRRAALYAGQSFFRDLARIAATLLIEQLRHLPARRPEKPRHPKPPSETRRLT